MTQVAIVGAGFAGLNAARILAERGISVVVIEAREHFGGRARTVHDDGAALPIELGPEYVHGCPDVTRTLAGKAGLEIESIHEIHRRREQGRVVEAGDVWERFATALEGAPDPLHDVSARAYLEQAHLSERDARIFATLVEGFYAAPLEDISIAGIAEDAGGAGDGDPAQTRLRAGYGALASWLASRLARENVTMHHGCVANAIAWGTGRVELACTRDGSELAITADRAIVTVPLGVLQAGTIRFSPSLGDHERALSRLAMGQVVKVVICLREPVWLDLGPNDLAFAHGDGTAFPTFWLRSRGKSTQLTAWAGGPHARALAGLSGDQLVERATDEFAVTVEEPRRLIASKVLHHHFHDYAADPFAYGAYSYTRVGGLGAAEQLAQPLRDTLFLAGEATDRDYEGSVAGALASGKRAAQQVLAVLER